MKLFFLPRFCLSFIVLKFLSGARNEAGESESGKEGTPTPSQKPTGPHQAT